MKRNLIPISALLTFGTISLANLETHGGMPTSDQWLGFVIAFTLISAGYDFGLPIAGGMAVLLMVAVLLSRGPEAFRFVMGTVSKQQTAHQRKKQPRHRRGVIAPSSEGSLA